MIKDIKNYPLDTYNVINTVDKTFRFTYPFNSPNDLVVEINKFGTELWQILNGNQYIVILDPYDDYGQFGTVKITQGDLLEIGDKLKIYRVTPVKQLSNFGPSALLNGIALSKAIDNLVMIQQEEKFRQLMPEELFKRSLRKTLESPIDPSWEIDPNSFIGRAIGVDLEGRVVPMDITGGDGDGATAIKVGYNEVTEQSNRILNVPLVGSSDNGINIFEIGLGGTPIMTEASSVLLFDVVPFYFEGEYNEFDVIFSINNDKKLRFESLNTAFSIEIEENNTLNTIYSAVNGPASGNWYSFEDSLIKGALLDSKYVIEFKVNCEIKKESQSGITSLIKPVILRQSISPDLQDGVIHPPLPESSVVINDGYPDVKKATGTSLGVIKGSDTVTIDSEGAAHAVGGGGGGGDTISEGLGIFVEQDLQNPSNKIVSVKRGKGLAFGLLEELGVSLGNGLGFTGEYSDKVSVIPGTGLAISEPLNQVILLPGNSEHIGGVKPKPDGAFIINDDGSAYVRKANGTSLGIIKGSDTVTIDSEGAAHAVGGGGGDGATAIKVGDNEVSEQSNHVLNVPIVGNSTSYVGSFVINNLNPTEGINFENLELNFVQDPFLDPGLYNTLRRYDIVIPGHAFTLSLLMNGDNSRSILLYIDNITLGKELWGVRDGPLGWRSSFNFNDLVTWDLTTRTLYFPNGYNGRITCQYYEANPGNISNITSLKTIIVGPTPLDGVVKCPTLNSSIVITDGYPDVKKATGTSLGVIKGSDTVTIDSEGAAHAVGGGGGGTASSIRVGTNPVTSALNGILSVPIVGNKTPVVSAFDVMGMDVGQEVSVKSLSLIFNPTPINYPNISGVRKRFILMSDGKENYLDFNMVDPNAKSIIFTTFSGIIYTIWETLGASVNWMNSEIIGNMFGWDNLAKKLYAIGTSLGDLVRFILGIENDDYPDGLNSVIIPEAIIDPDLAGVIKPPLQSSAISLYNGLVDFKAGSGLTKNAVTGVVSVSRQEMDAAFEEGPGISITYNGEGSPIVLSQKAATDVELGGIKGSSTISIASDGTASVIGGGGDSDLFELINGIVVTKPGYYALAAPPVLRFRSLSGETYLANLSTSVGNVDINLNPSSPNHIYINIRRLSDDTVSIAAKSAMSGTTLRLSGSDESKNIVLNPSGIIANGSVIANNTLTVANSINLRGDSVTENGIYLEYTDDGNPRIVFKGTSPDSTPQPFKMAIKVESYSGASPKLVFYAGSDLSVKCFSVNGDGEIGDINYIYGYGCSFSSSIDCDSLYVGSSINASSANITTTLTASSINVSYITVSGAVTVNGADSGLHYGLTAKYGIYVPDGNYGKGLQFGTPDTKIYSIINDTKVAIQNSQITTSTYGGDNTIAYRSDVSIAENSNVFFKSGFSDNEFSDNLYECRDMTIIKSLKINPNFKVWNMNLNFNRLQYGLYDINTFRLLYCIDFYCKLNNSPSSEDYIRVANLESGDFQYLYQNGTWNDSFSFPIYPECFMVSKPFEMFLDIGRHILLKNFSFVPLVEEEEGLPIIYFRMHNVKSAFDLTNRRFDWMLQVIQNIETAIGKVIPLPPAWPV